MIQEHCGLGMGMTFLSTWIRNAFISRFAPEGQQGTFHIWMQCEKPSIFTPIKQELNSCISFLSAIPMRIICIALKSITFPIIAASRYVVSSPLYILGVKYSILSHKSSQFADSEALYSIMSGRMRPICWNVAGDSDPNLCGTNVLGHCRAWYWVDNCQ